MRMYRIWPSREVSDPATKKPEFKKDWLLTESAFRQFLNWLDEGVDSDGEKYLEMRRRLVAYFDRKNCFSADELADETLNRVARRLEEEGSIETSPAHYCYIVAKFVFLEYLRRTKSCFGAELYDPETGAWSSTRPPRAYPYNTHGTVLLPNGKVLAVSGESPWDYAGAWAELYW